MTTKYKHPSLREAIVEMADDMNRLGIMDDAKYEKITQSTGNVFADLGIPDADMHLVKAKLVSRILDTMRDLGLTQTRAAELMGITQPESPGSATAISAMSQQSI